MNDGNRASEEEETIDLAEHIIETIREALVILKSDLRVRSANRTFYRTFQVTPEETEGRSLFELGNGQWDIPDLRRLLDEILPRNNPFDDFEVTHDFESIGRKTMLLNARRVERDGEPQLILLAIEDVTERREVEGELRSRTERLSLLVENVRDYAVIITDPEGTITEWQGGAERITGYTTAEAEGLKVHLLFTQEDREAGKPEREMEQAAAEGRVPEKRWHLKKDGSRFYGDGEMTALYDEGGNLRGFAKVFKDATSQVQAEESLRASEERYRSLFESMDEGYCVIEVLQDGGGRPVDYRFLEVNPAFERQTGLKEAAGRRMRELAPEHEGHWFETYGRVAETGEPVRFENEARALGGRWFDVYACRIGRPEERKVAILFTDITGRKQLERSLRHRVRDLAEADRRKNEFLAMLAHELRNPLSAIHSAVKVAQSPVMTEHQPQTLEVIERQARNLARLIDDLLDVSRITQGKIELKRETVEVVSIIHRAAHSVRPLIEQKGHHLTLHHDFGPIPVDADPTRLEQVVGNLLTNAAKYTDPGGHIAVSATRQGAEAVIRVTDDGVGISPEMLPTVFGLFTQVDRSLARSEGGLGIGLSLVKQLVEMHGGSVAAASEVGRGSEFTVRLPLVEAAAEESEPPRPATVPEAGMRVLIVDDNLDTARLTGRLLNSQGFEVRLCHDGRDAIEAAGDFRPEVVLLDIGLPGLNGFEVARRLREEACCSGSLIIGVSGYGDQQSRDEAREAGFDHHLVKPVDIEAVTELITHHRHH